MTCCEKLALDSDIEGAWFVSMVYSKAGNVKCGCPYGVSDPNIMLKQCSLHIASCNMTNVLINNISWCPLSLCWREVLCIRIILETAICTLTSAVKPFPGQTLGFENLNWEGPKNLEENLEKPLSR